MVPKLQRTVFLLGPEQVELREVPVPEPAQGEFLLRVRAANTCGTDVKVFRRGGHPRMLQPPCPFGHEMAGEVAAVGPGGKRWKVGDRVVVANSASCGECDYCRENRENLCRDLQYINGAFSEYILIPERFARRSTYAFPTKTLFEVAALAEPLACVRHGIDSIHPFHVEQDIIVFGAGPIGYLFSMDLHSRGVRVVIADVNDDRLACSYDLGAEPLKLSPGGGQAEMVRASAQDSAGFDVAIDATGVPEVWQDAIESVRPGGQVILFGGCAPGTSIPLDTHRLHYSELTVRGVYHHRPATFARALELLVDLDIPDPLDDRDQHPLLTAERPLEELEEALRSMMRGEEFKVVIRP